MYESNRYIDILLFVHDLDDKQKNQIWEHFTSILSAIKT